MASRLNPADILTKGFHDDTYERLLDLCASPYS